MKNKGFTLIELLAVIALLAIILMVVVPSLLKSYDNSKENLYNIMIDNICDATDNYYKEYQAGLIKTEQDICSVDSETKICTVDINDLIKNKYLNSNLKNPLTEKDITLSEVKITITPDTVVLDSVVTEIYTISVTIGDDEHTCN